MNRGDQPLQVIRPEDYLAISRGIDNGDDYVVITPKQGPLPIGILAREIIENVHFAPVLDAQSFNLAGTLGAAVYDDKMILILDLAALGDMVLADQRGGSGC